MHLAEGPLDALAVATMARDGAAVLGTPGAWAWLPAALAGWPGPVTLWVQADDGGTKGPA